MNAWLFSLLGGYLVLDVVASFLYAGKPLAVIFVSLFLINFLWSMIIVIFGLLCGEER